MREIRYRLAFASSSGGTAHEYVLKHFPEARDIKPVPYTRRDGKTVDSEETFEFYAPPADSLPEGVTEWSEDPKA